MKKVAKLLVVVMLFNYIFSLVNVFALTPVDALVCTPQQYTLGYANTNNTITNKTCFDSFSEARLAMKNDNLENNDNLVILDGNKKIVDAKYGLITLDITKNENTAVYYNANTTGDNFLINGYWRYYGADAALIEVLDNQSAYIKISGEKGYIKNGTYLIVPKAFVKSYNFYRITKDEISHCLTNDIEVSNNKYDMCIPLGKKPLQLEVGEYFSYDGNYFYKDLLTMLEDYKKGSSLNAVNANNKYYNYYLYLSHRTKTTYSSISIDEYFRTITSPNIIGKTYGLTNRAAYSMFYGEGYSFYEAQEKHGANAMLVLAVARNEAGPYGNSNIAMNKNNIFGHKAYDGDAFNQATGYISVRHSILQHASDYISYGYTDPNDYRYRGSNVGNKKNGLNVFYATDPYWGEKAVANYYRFDKANGFNDYNYYQIGITNQNNINFKTLPNNNSKTVYTTKLTDIPITIVEEVKGENINGNDVWYKTLSDLLVNDKYEMPVYNTNYSWDNSYVYVHSSQINKANQAIKLNNPKDTYQYVDALYNYKTFAKDGKLSPKVARLKNNTQTYFESSLTNINNVNLLSNKLVTVYEECFDKDNNIISYLVSTNNFTNQKHWVSAKDIELVDYNVLKVNMNKPDYYYDMYDYPNKNVINGIGAYTNNFLVIVDSVTVNNKVWLKVQYSLTNNDNSFTWVISDYSEGSLEYPNKLTAEAPVINALNKEVVIDKPFNPLEGVTASDKEDGDLTSKIKVIKNDVVIECIGLYEVTYEVSDTSGKKTLKTITINVTGLREKEGLFYFDNLKSMSDNKILISGFFGNKGIDNKEGLLHTIILKDVDSSKEYKFKMDNWKIDVPFTMTNVDDDKVYDYSGGWFKSQIDISLVEPGEYVIYIEVINGANRSYRLFNNLALKDITRKYEGINKSYTISTNYYEKTLPLSIVIRNDKLIGSSIPKTLDLMYNFFDDLSFNKNSLHILGTSHNIGIDYSKEVLVLRELIFENKKTFERTSHNVGSIDNGPYNVELRVPDLKDKTRVWYDSVIDISHLEVGEYVIYIKTTVDGFTDYGELSDISYKDLKQKIVINNKEYSFKRVNSKRFRVELVVKSL
ncbi:MAG: glucosaminidase domain-containing protein [Bacilli bacterium]